MSYSVAQVVEAGFDATIARVVDALEQEGFGVLSDIDVSAMMKQRLERRLPSLSHSRRVQSAVGQRDLAAEDKIGVTLPCNVIVQEAGAGKTEVAAIDPRAAMERVGNPALAELAREVAARLGRALATL